MSQAKVKVIVLPKRQDALEFEVQRWLDAGWTLRAMIDNVQASSVSTTVPAPALVGVFVSKPRRGVT